MRAGTRAGASAPARPAAPALEARPAVASPAVAPVEADTAPEPQTAPPAEVSQAAAVHAVPSAAPERRSPQEVTLARLAVDALLAGDRGRALQHYRELSRSSPERDAYREAVRLLTAAAPSPPR